MTKLIQGHLADDSAVYEYRGMSLNVREWSRSRMCKCSLLALRKRMNNGWNIGTALATPTSTNAERVKKPGKPGFKAKTPAEIRAEMLVNGATKEQMRDYNNAEIAKHTAKNLEQDRKREAQIKELAGK